MGAAQNMARRFAEMPCNLCNPVSFADEAKKLLVGCKVEAQ